MNYSIKSVAVSKNDGSTDIKQTKIVFGTTSQSEDILANPAELFLASFSACVLKNVERFSGLMKFEYSNAEIIVNATRTEKPPKIDEINYELSIYSQDPKLNINLLKRNIERFGTIFNTAKSSCTIVGEVKKISE